MSTTARDSIVAVVSQIFPQGGYGFAQTNDGQEIYFHEHVVGARVFGKLNTGDVVQLEAERLREDEHPHAVKLELIRPAQ